uniref:Type II toxin-antitoxin system VapC family toxin n=1 Tax=Acidobacterium capsulatum TaxID=33075 RepID=A0A7V5CTZ9_9BACT
MGPLQGPPLPHRPRGQLRQPHLARHSSAGDQSRGLARGAGPARRDDPRLGEGLVRSVIAYLDTNVVVWLAQGDLSRISAPALAVLEEADLRISPMVLIELEYLHEVRRILLSSREILLKIEHELGVEVCNLSFPRVAQVVLDEKWTRAPFDRTIVAHAKANGLASLVTAEEEIRKHYPKAVW